MSDHPVGRIVTTPMPRTRDRHLAAAVFNQPWAIAEPKLIEIADVLERHLAGTRLTEEEIRAAIDQRAGPPPASQQGQQGNGIAVIPVYGVIAYRMNLLSAFSGGSSLQRLTSLLYDAVQDESVSTIVLRCETPGGSVDGLTEFAATLRELRGRGTKRFVASVDVRALSAGYWIASQCDEICCTPSGFVGSIGIVTQYCDDSEAMKKAGVALEVISVPDKKGESMQPGPLSDDRRARMLDVMSQFYTMFVGDVAKGRSVSTATVKAEYGGGDVLTASEAKAAGMIDRIETFQATLARLGASKGAAVTVRAEGGAIGTSLGAAAEAATDPTEDPEQVEPDADGVCPNGYVLGDDGQCHLEADEADDHEAAARDAEAIAAVLGAHP
jgi:signal peptide peptidase SppA